MLATRVTEFAQVSRLLCCPDRTRAKPADSGGDPKLAASALLRARLCAARESNPQPAD
jgi:hypothetical protein